MNEWLMRSCFIVQFGEGFRHFLVDADVTSDPQRFSLHHLVWRTWTLTWSFRRNRTRFWRSICSRIHGHIPPEDLKTSHSSWFRESAVHVSSGHSANGLRPGSDKVQISSPKQLRVCQQWRCPHSLDGAVALTEDVFQLLKKLLVPNRTWSSGSEVSFAELWTFSRTSLRRHWVFQKNSLWFPVGQWSCEYLKLKQAFEGGWTPSGPRLHPPPGSGAAALMQAVQLTRSSPCSTSDLHCKTGTGGERLHQGELGLWAVFPWPTAAAQRRLLSTRSPSEPQEAPPSAVGPAQSKDLVWRSEKPQLTSESLQEEHEAARKEVMEAAAHEDFCQPEKIRASSQQSVLLITLQRCSWECLNGGRAALREPPSADDGRPQPEASAHWVWANRQSCFCLKMTWWWWGWCMFLWRTGRLSLVSARTNGLQGSAGTEHGGTHAEKNFLKEPSMGTSSSSSLLQKRAEPEPGSEHPHLPKDWIFPQNV